MDSGKVQQDGLEKSSRSAQNPTPEAASPEQGFEFAAEPRRKQIQRAPSSLAKGAGSTGGEIGAAKRARLANTLQRSIGNARVARLANPTTVGHGMASANAPSESGDNHNFPPSVNSAIKAGSGQSIDPQTRTKMEQAFGNDFSGVRIHTDPQAAEAAKDIQAHAFTHGQDIFFDEGQFQPKTEKGNKLLGHELTHTVQQRGTGGVQASSVPGISAISMPGEPQEQEAETLANQIASEGRIRQPVASTSSRMALQRQSASGQPSQLQQLDEMLDRFNVPEDQVIGLLGTLTSAEKSTVLAGGYKEKIASALNVSEMVRATNNLNPELAIKLEWVEAAAGSASSIDYPDIRSVVTSAPQDQRDVLKTTRWRDFFVGVCDNTTILEAVKDLKFDLVTTLEWVDEEVSRKNLSYSDIKPVITSVPQAERDRLKTPSWKDFFVGVCDNSTIITAVTDLDFDLKTQLEWIGEEASTSNIEYSQIQSLVTGAPLAERDILKTNNWRDFFVGVCDNSTIMDALHDLNFDFLTTIQWLLEEASVSNVDFIWLCNEFKRVQVFPPGEDTIACAIMERDIRDGTFNSSPDHTPAGWITRAHNQLLVATQMGGMVGETAKWKPSNPASGTNFQMWASAPAEAPLPPLSALFVLNCWEMVMLAAFRSGVFSWLKIHNIYTSGAPDWFAFLVNQLSFNKRIPYDPGSPAVRPVTGDIVFFDGAAHIALAAGSVDGLGRTEIYSFWPPPNTAFTAGGTIDDVKKTTIEELNDYWVGRGKPAFKIEFATPNW